MWDSIPNFSVHRGDGTGVRQNNAGVWKESGKILDYTAVLDKLLNIPTISTNYDFESK